MDLEENPREEHDCHDPTDPTGSGAVENASGNRHTRVDQRDRSGLIPAAIRHTAATRHATGPARGTPL